MKLINENLLRVASLGLFIMISVATTTAQDARIKTAQLDALAGKASQTVDVNLDERLMQFAAKFLNTKDPDEASVKEMVNGLKGIYVKFLEFDAEGQYTTADLDSIRSQVTQRALESNRGRAQQTGRQRGGLSPSQRESGGRTRDYCLLTERDGCGEHSRPGRSRQTL